jgi:hypothetical protein
MWEETLRITRPERAGAKTYDRIFATPRKAPGALPFPTALPHHRRIVATGAAPLIPQETDP